MSNSGPYFERLPSEATGLTSGARGNHAVFVWAEGVLPVRAQRTKLPAGDTHNCRRAPGSRVSFCCGLSLTSLL